MTFYRFFLLTLIGSWFTAVHAEQTNTVAEPQIIVYKTPTCGCCAEWVSYLQDNGFKVKSHDLNDLTNVKIDNGLTDPRLASCHTAIVDGYVVEGHVPVADIRRLLNEKPDIIGITAPGMPQLSPGMNSIEPIGYDVLSFDQNGNIRLFSRY